MRYRRPGSSDLEVSEITGDAPVKGQTIAPLATAGVLHREPAWFD
jgi:hypothetical protein